MNFGVCWENGVSNRVMEEVGEFVAYWLVRWSREGSIVVWLGCCKSLVPSLVTALPS